MNKFIAIFIAAFLASSMSFAENANDVIHTIPGAKSIPDMNSVTDKQETPIVTPNKNVDRGANKKKSQLSSNKKKTVAKKGV